MKDFERLFNIATEYDARTNSGTVLKLPVRVHLDFDSLAKFISIYIDSGLDMLSLIRAYVSQIELTLSLTGQYEVGVGYPDLGIDTKSSELQFTGRLFVYVNSSVPDTVQEQAKAYCAEQSLHLVIRDQCYAKRRNKLAKPEAFISHDSRDKVEVAEAIAIGLEKRACPVWYDEFSLRIGDSLRESVERGIREARACIVVISPNFLANSGWTKAEFNAIFTREIIERRKVLLPVWHHVSPDDVYTYSPILADRVALNTEMGMEKVVRRLHSAIESSKY